MLGGGSSLKLASLINFLPDPVSGKGGVSDNLKSKGLETQVHSFCLPEPF